MFIHQPAPFPTASITLATQHISIHTTFPETIHLSLTLHYSPPILQVYMLRRPPITHPGFRLKPSQRQQSFFTWHLNPTFIYTTHQQRPVLPIYIPHQIPWLSIVTSKQKSHQPSSSPPTHALLLLLLAVESSWLTCTQPINHQPLFLSFISGFPINYKENKPFFIHLYAHSGCRKQIFYALMKHRNQHHLSTHHVLFQYCKYTDSLISFFFLFLLLYSLVFPYC